MKKKKTNDYLKLPYTIEFRREDSNGQEGGWFARVVELPGCITEGNTLKETAEMIHDAMASWIEVALEDGRPIPLPKPSKA
jgi:antitoxin HicB